MVGQRALGNTSEPADEILLDKLADRKAIDLSAKTAVIIKQLINIHTDTGGLRRLQRAFKQNEPGLIAAARERVRAGQEAERDATFVKNVEAKLETSAQYATESTHLTAHQRGKKSGRSSNRGWRFTLRPTPITRSQIALFFFELSG